VSINEHLNGFAGLAVCDHVPGEDLPLDPAAAAWRVSTRSGSTPFEDVFDDFVRRVDTSRITALVIGYFGVPSDDGRPSPVELLVRHAGAFAQLDALFLADVVSEELEISWIPHTEITPLFEAFPGLECLEVRGSQGLKLRPVRSERLRTLRFESGGLPTSVIRAVADSDLPNLEHLDLWLGIDDYGFDGTVDDLEPFLSGARLPALRHLGLVNSEIQNEIAAALAAAPVVAQLESLDLSMGTLDDTGAESLLMGQPLTHLKVLDLHHHYLSDEMVTRLDEALPDVDLDTLDQEFLDEDGPFVAVDE
jgi:hypothetical protein